MNKKKKQTIAAIAATALLVSGTYAWQAFDQIVRNESAGFDADQGARLHNDFDGSNADVYVENYASHSGATVYTRVRLYEYMELGTGAGNLKDSEGTALDYDAKVAAGITVLRGDLMENSKPDINDESTWDVYLHEGNSRGEEDIHTYLNINYGDVDNSNKGAKVYMPTFNKNFDDNTADIKGSLNNSSDRTDGDRVATDAYDSYVEYTLGETLSGTAVYSKDALIVQDTSAGTIDGNTFLVEDEEHTAKSTLEGYVITMEDWLALEGLAQIGDFWVIDTDGWAYWANGIAPQTATSLLVDSITKVRQPDESYHYALHVEAQSATSDGWIDGVAAMNKGDVDENALSLMEMCWDTDAAIFEITSIALATTQSYVLIGDELELSATITTPETAEKAKTVLWTIEEEVSDTEMASFSSGLSETAINAMLSSKGVFKPTNTAMHMKNYIVTATAKYDTSKSQSTTIAVYDPDQAFVMVNGYNRVFQGGTSTYTAEVIGMTSSGGMTWSLIGGNGSSSVSTDGVVTIAASEADDTVLTVTAQSSDTGLMGSTNLTVVEFVEEDAVAIAGTTATVSFNGTEFYVLATDTVNDRAVVRLLTKENVGTSNYRSGTSSSYSGSTLATSVATWQTTWLAAGSLSASDVYSAATVLTQTEAAALSTAVRKTGETYWTQTYNTSTSVAANTSMYSRLYYLTKDEATADSGTVYYRAYRNPVSAYSTYSMKVVNASGTVTNGVYYTGSYTYGNYFGTSSTTPGTMTNQTMYYYTQWGGYPAAGSVTSSSSVVSTGGNNHGAGSETLAAAASSSGVRPVLWIYL